MVICLLCLYSQPYAVVVATVRMVEVPVHVQRHVHVTTDGLDQTVKHVCKLLEHSRNLVEIILVG